MDVSSIIAELRRERERIDDAIAAMERIDGKAGNKRGRSGKRRHRLTAAGRKRLSEMMKKRWSERKRRSRAA